MLHEVERGLDLVGAIGLTSADRDLVLCIPPAARRSFELKVLSSEYKMLSNSKLVVVHPGCSMPARTYPGELYGEVADLLIEQLGARVVLTGSPAERELAERVRQRVHERRRDSAIVLAGELEFAEFCALIEAADLTITNNTGPMHIAAAVKTPVVALFALTNPPEQWGPWRVPHRLLYHDVACRLCYSRVCPYEHECLRQVSPQTVADAASELLSGLRGVGGGSQNTGSSLSYQSFFRSATEKAFDTRGSSSNEYRG